MKSLNEFDQVEDNRQLELLSNSKLNSTGGCGKPGVLFTFRVCWKSFCLEPEEKNLIKFDVRKKKDLPSGCGKFGMKIFLC